MLVRWQGQNGIPTGLSGQGPTIPWYQSAQFNSQTPLVELGSFWYDEATANVFQYVKTTVGLTIGQLVTTAAPGTDTVVNAGSTTSVVNINTGNLTANAEVGNYVYFADIPAMRPIVANAAASITVATTDSILGNNQPGPNVLPSVPGNGTDVVIFRPFQMRVCTGVLCPCGVALGTVTANYYTMVQVAGLAQVAAVGNGTAIVAGVPAVPSTAGVIIGGGGVAFAYTPGAAIIPIYGTASAGLVIPCNVNFIGS